MKNAETLFQTVFDRASKGTNAAWKKFLYGSSVGMVGLVLSFTLLQLKNLLMLIIGFLSRVWCCTTKETTQRLRTSSREQ